jgi:C2H2-type zinc finger
LKCLDAEEYFQKLPESEEFIVDALDDEFTENCWTKTDVTAEPISITQVDNSQKLPCKVKARKSKVRYKPICGYCGKEQESDYRLKQHELLSHTPLNQLSPSEVFTCDKCSREFKTKQSIRNHFIRAHTPKSEVFPCSICGKVS